MWFSGVIYAVLGFLFYVLTSVFDLPRFDLELLHHRIKACTIEFNILMIAVLISFVVSMVMLGGTGQTFEGDAWWPLAGKMPRFAAVTLGFSRQFQRLGYENMVKFHKGE